MNSAAAALPCKTGAGPFASGAGLLARLVGIGSDAAKAVGEMFLKTPAAPAAAFAVSFGRLAEAVARLVGLSHRLRMGQGFPPPRAARTEPDMPRDAAPQPCDPGPRDPEIRVPFRTLFELGVPEAAALRERLDDLLAEPEIAEMVATQAAAWRAAAPIARALGLKLARPPEQPAALLPLPPAASPPIAAPEPAPPPAPAPAPAPAPRVKRHWFHDRKRNKRRPRAG